MGDCENGVIINSVNINSTEKIKEMKSNSITQKLSKILSLVRENAYIIEPIFIFYFMASVSETSACVLVCKDAPELCEKLSAFCKIGSNYHDDMMEKCISLIASVFLAAWSDKIENRKILFIVPVLGKMISLCGSLFAVFMNWPLWIVYLISILPRALGGDLDVIFIGCLSYIADVIKPKLRAMRLGFFMLILLRTEYIFERIIVSLVESTNNFCFYAIVLSSYLLALIFAFIGIEDVRKIQVKGTWYSKIFQFVHPRNVWDTVSLVITTRGHQFHVIVLLILYDLIDVFVTIGVMVTNTIFIEKLQLHDTVLGIIGISCQVASKIYFGLVSDLFWHYLGAIINIFPMLARVVFFNLTSKVAGPTNIAKLYCLTIVMRTIFDSTITSSIQKSTFYHIVVSSFQSGTLVCYGFLATFEIFIFIALYILFKKKEDNGTDNPVVEENNEVTTL